MAAVGAAPTVSVFPNPAPDGRFRVRVGGGGGGRPVLAVFDALGREVARQAGSPTADTPLDLHAQPPGVYVLRLTWPDGVSLTRRLMR